MEENDMYVTYLNKEIVDVATYSLFEQGTLNVEDNFIIIENIKNGIRLKSDEYDDMTIYCTEDEVFSKVKNYSKIYDSIHLRFFDIDLDDIKEKYAKIANESNTVIAFFEETEDTDYYTTIPLNSKMLIDLSIEEWNKKKDILVDAINDIAEKAEKKIDSFTVDYSFNIKKSKKKLNIEFDENKRLYRLKSNSTSDLVLDCAEVEDLMNIFDFFMQKSRD